MFDVLFTDDSNAGLYRHSKSTATSRSTSSASEIPEVGKTESLVITGLDRHNYTLIET